MPTTTVIANIQTEDKTPAVAPYVISPDPSHRTVTFDFTPTHDGVIVPSNDLIPGLGAVYPTAPLLPTPGLHPMVGLHPGGVGAALFPDSGAYPDSGGLDPGNTVRDMVGYVVREGGTDSTTGRVVAQNVKRCSSSRACGTRPALNSVCSSTDFRSPSGTTIHFSEIYPDFNDGGADGPRTVNVWALTENQGWS